MVAAIGGGAPAAFPLIDGAQGGEKAGKTDWAKVVIVVLKTLGLVVKEVFDKQEIEATNTTGQRFRSNLDLTKGGHRPRFKEVLFNNCQVCYFEYASSITGHGCQIEVVSPFKWTSQVHETGAFAGSAKEARKKCQEELLQKLLEDKPQGQPAGPDPTPQGPPPAGPAPAYGTQAWIETHGMYGWMYTKEGVWLNHFPQSTSGHHKHCKKR